MTNIYTGAEGYGALRDYRVNTSGFDKDKFLKYRPLDQGGTRTSYSGEINPADRLRSNLPGSLPGNGVLPDPGFGWNKGTANTIGTVASGAGALFQGYLGLKNYNLNKDNMEFQQAAYRENVDLQKKTINNEYKSQNDFIKATHRDKNAGIRNLIT